MFHFRFTPSAQLPSSAPRLRQRVSTIAIIVGSAMLAGCQADSPVRPAAAVPTSMHALHNTLPTTSDIQEAILTIQNLESAINLLGLDVGTATSINTKLNAALADLASGDIGAACAALQDYLNFARAQLGKKLPLEQEPLLIKEASRVRGILGC
jgi:hypothetical protein